MRIVVPILALLLGACATGGVRDSSRLRPPDPAVANAVLFRALSLVGTPYRGGGNRPETGFDCSGLVGYVFSDAAGIALPRTTRALAALAAPAVSRGQLAAGDLVLFRIDGDVAHVGIYVGDGRFVHAPSSGGTVRMDAIDSDYWRGRFAGGRRLARQGAGAGVGSASAASSAARTSLLQCSADDCGVLFGAPSGAALIGRALRS